MIIRAYAPASIGNFAAGFDLLGAAIAPLDGSLWGDVVSAEPAAEPAAAPSLTLSGRHAGGLPADPRQNLVLRTDALVREALRARGRDLPALAFHLEKNLPLSSGLGSSSSSVAATLVACQGVLAAAGGEPLPRAELHALAGRAEALVSGSVHLDNVVPALEGGMQLIVPGQPGKPAQSPGQPDAAPESRALAWPDDLVLVLAMPAFELPTERSRAVLPRCFPLAATLAFAQNLAGFVHALESGDRELLRRCLRDVLTEPHRAALVPGFRAAQAAALAQGALGCGLSGSGPALFAVAESRPHAGEIAAALQGALGDAGLAAEVRACGLDRLGARLLA